MLANRPAPADLSPRKSTAPLDPGLFETESVKDFGSRMDELSLLDWWRRGMGYLKEDMMGR